MEARWFGWQDVASDEGWGESQPISYVRVIWYSLAVFLALSLLVWGMIRLFKKENIAIGFGSGRFRFLVLAGLSLFIIFVIIMGWLVLEQNRKMVFLETGDSLKEILKTANDRLNLWIAQKKSHVRQLGGDQHLGALTQSLLSALPNKENLLVYPALKDMRSLFEAKKDILSCLDFYIINPNMINLASMNDADIGIVNQIAEKRPDLADRAFQGEVLNIALIDWENLLIYSPKPGPRSIYRPN